MVWEYLKSWVWTPSPPPPPPSFSLLTFFENLTLGDLKFLFWVFMHDILPILFFLFLLRSLADLAADKDAKKKGKKILESFGINPRDHKLTSHDLVIASDLIHPKVLDETWTSVGGHETIVTRLKEAVILPLKIAQSGMNLPALARPPNGILLHGAPGCGKTLLAKALAKNGQYKFLNINASSFTNKYYGETEKLIKALFNVANIFSPTIIFLDEIDAILSKRGGDHEWEFSRTVKTLFMQLWDGLLKDPKKTVIILGATNRPSDLDEAVLRRMPLKIEVPLPTAPQRGEIMKVIMDQSKQFHTLEDDVDIGRLAELTEGFSGSDLKEVVRSACIRSLKEEFGVGIEDQEKEDDKKAKELAEKPAGNWITKGLRKFFRRRGLNNGTTKFADLFPHSYRLINKILGIIPFRKKDPKSDLGQLAGQEKKIRIKMPNLVAAVEETKSFKTGQNGGKDGFSYYI